MSHLVRSTGDSIRLIVIIMKLYENKHEKLPRVVLTPNENAIYISKQYNKSRLPRVPNTSMGHTLSKSHHTLI